MRRAILDAARHLFIAEGYANVPIRRIAARIEYSAAAIYRYFETKNEIFYALADEGFRMLIERQITAAPPPEAPPIDRLRHFFNEHYEFSRRHAEYFYLMFLDRSVPLNTYSSGLEFIERLLRNGIALVDACVKGGEFAPRTNRQAVFDTLLSATHGAAAFHVCGRERPGIDKKAMFQKSLDVIIDGLRAHQSSPAVGRGRSKRVRQR